MAPEEMGWLSKFCLWAVLLGGISAISLPLGSLCGLWLKPSPRITGALAAFGGGALMAALTIELVAPSALVISQGSTHGAHDGGHVSLALLAVCGGMFFGGILFFVLDALVNEKGGFLRHTMSTMTYLSRAKAQRNAETLTYLSQVEILRHIPEQGIERLLHCVRPRKMLAGEILFREGDTGDAVYFVVNGTIALQRGTQVLPSVSAGGVVGEIALLTGAPRTASGKAETPVHALVLRKDDWDHLRHEIPGLEDACRTLASHRLEEMAANELEAAQARTTWLKSAQQAMQSDMSLPSPSELRHASKEHHGAPLAIWLGILLDGIPESFVIGAGFFGVLAANLAAQGVDSSQVDFFSLVPYTLIAGLFLSNFPEAMSSSVGMSNAGFSTARILFLWTSLLIMTALGAGVGFVLGGSAPHTVVLAIEGMAAGAMFAMIFSAMIPEAVHLSGAKIAGISGLVGFLTAILFKLLE